MTEFLAVNDGLLKDEDGESPPWIELYNTGTNTVDLTGWHLTDAPGNPIKWTFPSTNMSAGSYLIVFASGKNRAVPGGRLHTNFELDGGGGYLALVRADGTTIEHAYNYTNQRANVSYGLQLQVTNTTLIGTNAAARVLVPSNNALGLTWTARTYVDSAWYVSNTPVAFAMGTVSTQVLAIDINQRTNAATTTQAGFTSFVLNTNSPWQVSIVTQATTRVIGGISVTLSNSGGYGCDDRLRGTPANSGAFTESLLLRDFVFSRDDTGTSGLDVIMSGFSTNRLHRLTVWSFDSGSGGGEHKSDWSANGVTGTNGYSFNGSVLPTADDQRRFSFNTTSDANGKIVLSARRNPTGITFGVFLNALKVEALSPAPATNGLAALMLSNNATAYMRVPFTVANTNAFQLLRLKMKYDDGFVAYINGQVVASRNAPGSPTWNSTATAVSTNVTTYEEFIIPNTPGLLANGANVLAIQGLNASATDDDFLIQPELEAISTGVGLERYFVPTTVAAPNGQGYLGLVADTKFSVDRGFHDTPFSVAITSATVTASIYFTTDGSIPAPTNGTLYTDPIPVSGNTFLRAAAYLSNYVASVPDCQTYLFLSDVFQQPAAPPGYPMTWQASYPADYEVDPVIVTDPNYGATIADDMRAIPTLSLVTTHSNWWDPSNGIYVDATKTGDAWERPASAELFNGTNKTLFQANCSVQMQGNASRDNVRTPKHSIRLQFRSATGPSKLKYDWFKDSPVTSFDNIILRAGFTDSWPTRYSDSNIVTNSTWRGLRYRPESALFMRDPWVKDSQRAMGWLSAHSDYVHVYLNGLYWGVYNNSERLDASMISSHLGGLEEDWDVIAYDDPTAVVAATDGNITDWNAMMALVAGGVSSESAYQAIGAVVDIDNLIDYMMLHGFAEAEDWPSHNWYAAHRRATNGLPATKWIFLTWDQDITIDVLVRRDRVNVSNSGTPAGIYNALRAWPEFRRQFGDRVQKHLFNNGALTPSNNVARMMARAARLDRAIVGESARWGDAREFPIGANPGTGVTFTRDEWWIAELQKVCTNLFQVLNYTNIARFRAASLYPNLDAPRFNQFGGNVPAGFSLVITNPNLTGTIYFTLDGTDPRTYGTGAVAPTAQAYSVPVLLNQPVLARTRVFDGANWSALVETSFAPPQDLSKLALTELMYNPPALGPIPGNDLEFVEMKNVGTNTLDLSGLVFSGINFTFTNGSILNPGQFCVIARNGSAFSTKYPGVPIRGVYDGQLDNAGETLTLSYPGTGNVFSVTYNDKAPWPAAADGYGFSIVPKQPGVTQAPDDGTKWRASKLVGGSPGADDPAPNIAPIVVNEILAHTDPPDRDSIELYNPTATNVNISGWYLTDDVNTPMKFRIPNGTVISPFGYVYFDENSFNAGTNGNIAFLLTSTGEDAYIFSGTNGQLTGYSHGVSFGATFNGSTLGRYVNSVGEEFYPLELSRTFGSANSAPRIGPVIINEINYNPAPGGDEFIELFNSSTDTAAFFSLTNAWKIGGLGYTFPTNVTIAGQQLVLIVATNPASFRAKYNVATNVQIFGPYAGSLQDGGENLTLDQPDTPNTNLVPYVTVEAVRYNDKAPWPPGADGSGQSLQRLSAFAFGNEPMNWIAATPTPGRLADAADSDGDGMPDWWEIANGTNWRAADSTLDPDHDGLTNGQEYLAGTNPFNAASNFKLSVVAGEGNVMLQFPAVSNRTYSVLYKDSLLVPGWQRLADVPSQSTNRLESVIDSTDGYTNRFYKLVTPQWP